VVEPSPDAIATLYQRAEEAGVTARITVIADDSETLSERVPPGSADLVLAHGLLEVVDEPQVTMAELARLLAPRGSLSIVVANRYAAILHRVFSGHVEDAIRLLSAPTNTSEDRLDGDTPLRRFDVATLRELVSSAGLTISLLQGDGVVSDLFFRSNESPETIAEFEAKAAGVSPLRDIASRLHVIARR
jgi:SAM-dependent methyltransferase